MSHCWRKIWLKSDVVCWNYGYADGGLRFSGHTVYTRFVEHALQCTQAHDSHSELSAIVQNSLQSLGR